MSDPKKILQSALKALEHGYEVDGVLETNINCRVGWAMGCIREVLEELERIIYAEPMPELQQMIEKELTLMSQNDPTMGKDLL